MAIVRGPDHYTVADLPSTPPNVVIYPGVRCTSADDGRALWDEWLLGIRTWGQNPDGDCVLLVGTYEGKGEASQPLLTALPNVVLLSREEAGTPLLQVLAEEMQVEAPGQRALLDRLLDILLISTLRTWFAGRADEAPGWFRAQHDPAVGQALSLLPKTWHTPGRSRSSPPRWACPEPRSDGGSRRCSESRR